MMTKDYYPGDLAEFIMKLSGAAGTENEDAIRDDLTDALYYLMACAENEYNKDYFRTMWSELQRIADIMNCGIIRM